MIDPSAFETFLPPHQREALRGFKEVTKGIKAQINIHNDGVEVKLISTNNEVAQCLPQVEEQLATSIGMTLHYMFDISGEIVRHK